MSRLVQNEALRACRVGSSAQGLLVTVHREVVRVHRRHVSAVLWLVPHHANVGVVSGGGPTSRSRGRPRVGRLPSGTGCRWGW